MISPTIPATSSNSVISPSTRGTRSYEYFIAVSDKLFRSFAPRWLLLERTAKLTGLPGLAWTTVLRSTSQADAERQHARARRHTLTEDLREQRALGFAGTDE